MKKLIFKILRFSGLPNIFRNTIQKNKISIFMLHDIDVNTAEMCFSFLNRTYNIISLNTLIDAHYNNDNTKIPQKAAIITFDDGHIRNYDFLNQIKKYELPITIFLCSEIVDTNRHYWFKVKGIENDVQQLKKLKTDKRLRELKKVGFTNDKEYSLPQALQINHLTEMRPYVNFQSHTQFHPILPKCDDKTCEVEITQSKTDLENNFNLEINAFAYPNGDYGDREIEYVKNAGYQCAVTVDSGFNTRNSDIFRLKRISLSDSDNIDEIIVKASGLWSYFMKILKN